MPCLLNLPELLHLHAGHPLDSGLPSTRKTTLVLQDWWGLESLQFAHWSLIGIPQEQRQCLVPFPLLAQEEVPAGL